ncbi:V-type ATP synthase subunit F [Thiocapsa marina]|uniref:Vacuolar H+transporting two-sector ATPase F subunit n=1 Tax=Thiocapsa marina 5811 TaxID=768671 RepID=F9UIF0_9GAMM|nr:V-type ATP synthase subunit F [Thiocapsa marina]EGV16038.1 Vacuolar H+transporting two-sector ATPase F subunit [Thiocapsa marina 5811]
MVACAFIGDEISGLGFRLAGVEVHCPEPREVRGLFQRLREADRVIVMTAEIAAALPPELLREAESATWPLVLVVPDVRNRVAAPDLVADVRRHLGMAE